jgi:hypothetical protein
VRSAQRRYLATIVVFGAASLAILAVLALRPGDRISYDLPELTPFDGGEVTAITIERADESVTLRREDDRWLVTPGDYLADTLVVGAIQNTLASLTVTDVVSVTDDPARYDLDEERRVRVTAEGGAGTLRVLDVGRRAATFGHTFVRIPGDERILQAGGELRGLFDRDLDSFRDHSVMTFDPATISAITVTRTLPAQRPQTVQVDRSLLGWERVTDGAEVEPQASGLDPQRIEAALRFLGNLSTHRYSYGDEPLGDPWLSVTLEGEATYTLRLYPQQGSVYPASSSESSDDFNLFLFQAGLMTEPFGFE